MVWQAIVGFFKAVGSFYVKYKAYIDAAVAIATLAVGVKGYRQAQDMLAQAQAILANKVAAGGKMPVVYGTRRVGTQIVYMDVSNNDSRHLFVVYALSVGECDEILYRTIELDGNPITDPNRFKYGCYVGSDRNNQTGYSGHRPLNTVSQEGSTISAGAGQFGTNQNARYRITLNLHHGTASQTADPMLVASMPNWTTSHRLDGVCYIAAHYKYDKEGMFSGIPQLTVQVKGKRIYDPRDTNQQFGTPTTYKHSDNPALVFLDYITNNEYGKGLTSSQINMSTFSSAANVCDTQVDQPYFNGSAQSLTWSANSGDDFFTISGTGANAAWWQNKIGELLDLFDANGNGVLDEVEIKEIQRTEYFDTTQEFIVFINDYFSSSYSSQNGSSLLKVKRFTTNGYLDSNKNVMENAKELLSNMRGIFLYINGQYELSIEDTGTSSFSINDNHIISDAGISVDYGNKDKKANKVIVEFFNANKKYELDTATVLHDASPEYYSDDNDEILEIKAEFPYVTDPYIAYNMGKAILTRRRNKTTMQFLGTPEMYKINVGDIVDLTYAGLGFSGKVCRVEALELQPNGLVAVSLIEYFDVYTWEVPPQEPVEELANLPSAYAVKAPTGLSFTDTDSSSTGRPFLSWNEPTDFPDYQYRVNVVDSSGNQVLNRIVDVENCDLNFVPTASNYVASVSSLNTLGSESDAATLTFTIGDAPTGSADIKNNAVITDKIINDAITTPKILDDAVTDAKINSLSANKITAGTIDASQITVTNLDADNITSGTLATARLNVTDIISTGNIIVQNDNISELTNDSAFINGGQVNSNVTSISGGVIQTGTIEANRLNVGTLSAISANMGAITAGTINNTTNTPTAGQEPTGSQAGTAIDLASGSFTFGNVNSFLYFNTTDGLVQGGLTPFRDTVSIYYQGSTAPSTPSDSSMTYTSTGAFSFTTNAPTGWTLSIPNTTDNIYVVQANIGRTGAGTTTASWGAVSLLRSATVTGTSLATSPATIAFSYASTTSTSPESYSNSYTVTASGAYSHSVGITATVSSGTWQSLGASSITVSEVSGDTGEFTISSITHQSNFEEKAWSWTVTHTSSGSTVSQQTLSINPLLQ